MHARPSPPSPIGPRSITSPWRTARPRSSPRGWPRSRAIRRRRRVRLGLRSRKMPCRTRRGGRIDRSASSSGSVRPRPRISIAPGTSRPGSVCVPVRTVMTEVRVSCTASGSGWTCAVDLSDPDGSTSRHRVTVSATDLARLDPGATDPTDLVRRSFVFLLAREPKGSILSTFDLPVIGRYFPEYERWIRDGPR